MKDSDSFVYTGASIQHKSMALSSIRVGTIRTKGLNTLKPSVRNMTPHRSALRSVNRSIRNTPHRSAKSHRSIATQEERHLVASKIKCCIGSSKRKFSQANTKKKRKSSLVGYGKKHSALKNLINREDLLKHEVLDPKRNGRTYNLKKKNNEYEPINRSYLDKRNTNINESINNSIIF